MTIASTTETTVAAIAATVLSISCGGGGGVVADHGNRMSWLVVSIELKRCTSNAPKGCSIEREINRVKADLKV